MFERNPTRPRARGTFVLVLATLLAASMYFASAADVGAMLTGTHSATTVGHAETSAPVELPPEWVWRGRKPVDLEFMYGHREAPREDWIRVHRDE